MAKSRKTDQGGGPQFGSYFGPVLDALRELGGSGSPDEVTATVARNLKISDEVQNELLPSGGSTRFRNRVAWARFYLVKAGLVDSPRRGLWRLTSKGQSTALTPEQARQIFYEQTSRFQKDRRDTPLPAADETIALAPTDDEVLPDSIGYRDELLKILLALPPEGFERLSQRMLREAGFNEVVVTGRSGDGGIDGRGDLEINPLVSLRVLFQCKRYSGNVSPSQIRDFRGAMAGRADKGLMITTGSFTAEARREALRDGAAPIELIDGDRLIDLLGRFNLGLKPVQTFAVDEAFFSEFGGRGAEP